MTDVVLYDAAVKELLNAYFSEYAISSLVRSFDRVVTVLNSRNLLQKNWKDQQGEMVKYLLAFLITLLVEHGQMDNLQRYVGNAGIITASVCNLENFQSFCSRLGRHEDYLVWTHMILYMISVFREERFIATYGDRDMSDNNILNTDGWTPAFLSNVILLLYGFLITRLVLSALNLPSALDRYNVEACMFATFLSFYYDYVSFTKNLSVTASIRHWELLEESIRTTYLQHGRFFITFQLRFPLNSYLDQDNIVGFYGVINKHFLQPYKKHLAGASTMTDIDIYPAMTKLHNIDLNSISMIYNRWFRYLVYSKFMKKTTSNIKFVKDTVVDIYGGLRDSVMLGIGAYSHIYTDTWPVASNVSGVTVGLIAFAGSTWSKFAKNRLAWGWKQLSAAAVYAFRKKDLFPNKPLFQMQFQRPKRPAYLEWIRSPDGTFSVIYSVTPIPTPSYGTNEPFTYIQRGGASSKKKKDLEMLAKAIKKGYVKNSLPIEMQIYIKNKLAIKTKMQGGGNRWMIGGGGGNHLIGGDDSYNSISDLTVGDEDDDFSFPPGYTREIIDVAEDEAFFREDPDGITVQLVMPKTPLEKESIENAFFVDVSEPALDVEKPPVSENRLPEPIPEIDLEKPTMVQEKVKAIRNDIPSPPVDPALALPTLNSSQAMKIYEKTIVPKDRYVKMTRTTRTSRRRYR